LPLPRIPHTARVVLLTERQPAAMSNSNILFTSSASTNATNCLAHQHLPRTSRIPLLDAQARGTHASLKQHQSPTPRALFTTFVPQPAGRESFSQSAQRSAWLRPVVVLLLLLLLLGTQCCTAARTAEQTLTILGATRFRDAASNKAVNLQRSLRDPRWTATLLVPTNAVSARPPHCIPPHCIGAQACAGPCSIVQLLHRTGARPCAVGCALCCCSVAPAIGPTAQAVASVHEDVQLHAVCRPRT
jgi:hypothetical protein